MKHYEFRITLSGYGENAEEAWEDAVEGFSQDPGGFSKEDIILEENAPYME